MYFTAKCNHHVDCVDSSDEIGCHCKEKQFVCQCYKNDPVTCFFDEACISSDKYHDGIKDCPDGSDETQFINIAHIGSCSVTMQRFNDMPQCNDSLNCDNSTCYETPSLQCSSFNCNITDVICSSCCLNNETNSCEPFLQCADGSLILARQFCNGHADCPDGSDEVRNQPGFKCSKSFYSCNLPQLNLYDDFPHCVLNHRDLCIGANGVTSCFECYDKRLLISTEQVCDDVIDCYDLSDECLCETHLNNPICLVLYDQNVETTGLSNAIVHNIDQNAYKNNPKLVSAFEPDGNINVAQFFVQAISMSECETRSGYIKPVLCDGRPECRDFSDECDCEDSPPFCNDTCRLFYKSFYPFGNLYCNGIEDKLAWNYINKSACPLGFDETRDLCPKRFYCISGDRISIDVSEVCNGIANCDDKSDEENCSDISVDLMFSSETEMIANPFLRSAFWIIGMIVIGGNLSVIITKIKFLKNNSITSSFFCQHFILLNISCADLIMGIYLLAIAGHSAIFSGYYGSIDIHWRTSWSCSVIGSLAVVSSEASCFFMVILTGFRLHGICRPYASRYSPTWPWKFAIFVLWIISLILALLPIFHVTFDDFVHQVFFPIEFQPNGVWKKHSLAKFVSRYAAVTNKTIDVGDGHWQEIRHFLKANFPDKPLINLGYYGHTSICMPMLYVTKHDSAWGYSFGIIMTNFLCFLFIAIGYVGLFMASNKSIRREAILQKRIARIIATDFFCWMPIFILSFVKLNGVQFPSIIYQITAVFLLPINSALNPLLYSSALDKAIERLKLVNKKSRRLTCFQ